MAKTVFDVLINNIDKQILSAKEHMTGGVPKDYPAYRETVGLLRGLGYGREIVEDLQRNYMKDEDDD